jgi:hypothetical protein
VRKLSSSLAQWKFNHHDQKPESTTSVEQNQTYVECFYSYVGVVHLKCSPLGPTIKQYICKCYVSTECDMLYMAAKVGIM